MDQKTKPGDCFIQPMPYILFKPNLNKNYSDSDTDTESETDSSSDSVTNSDSGSVTNSSSDSITDYSSDSDTDSDTQILPDKVGEIDDKQFQNKPDWYTCACDVLNEDPEIQKWTNENSLIQNQAAYNEHIKILKKALLKGCPKNKWSRAHTAFGGYLKGLKCVQENGLDWNDDYCEKAFTIGYFEIIPVKVCCCNSKISADECEIENDQHIKMRQLKKCITLLFGHQGLVEILNWAHDNRFISIFQNDNCFWDEWKEIKRGILTEQ